MSRIYLLAADKPLPLCDFQEMREHQIDGNLIVFAAGFAALLNSRLGLVSAKGEKKPSEPKASSPSRYLRSPKERF